MGKIIEGIGSIVDGIKSVLIDIFIPSDGFLDKKIDELRSNFAFADSIIGTANILFDFFKTSVFNTPPKLDLNLSSTEGKYNYGNFAVALDMSWYTRYKPSVDIILSGILWVVFVWNTFKTLPNTINGVGGQIVSSVASADKFEKEQIKQAGRR